MRHLLIALCLATTTAHAGGYHRVLEEETKETALDSLERITCEPGENRAHHFPTPSQLVVNVKDLLEGRSAIGNLVYDDVQAGDHCRALVLNVAAKLPGILQVTRKKIESCVEEVTGPNRIRAHYITWQEVHGGALGIELRGGYETLEDRYEIDASCRQ